MAEAKIFKVIREQREAVNRDEKTVLLDLARRWLPAQRYLNQQINDLMKAIADLMQKGEPVPISYVHSLDRYRKMADAAFRQIDRYNQAAAKVITGAEADAQEIGSGNARQLISLAAGDSPIKGLSPTIAVPTPGDPLWTRVNTRETRILSGMMSEGSPLYQLLRKSYAQTMDEIDKALTIGMSTGQGSSWIANQLSEAAHVPLERALVIARTEVNRAYREANLETMRESRAVIGYRRMCYPPTACFACLMLDGEYYDKLESFSDHPNGKCSAVPVTKHFDPINSPDWERGQNWFAKQDEETQRKLMGAGRFDLWKQGGMDPHDMVYIKPNQTWGGSPAVRTLKSLESQKSIKYYSAAKTGDNSQSHLSKDTRNEIVSNGLRNLNFTHHLDKMGINALQMDPEEGFQDVIIHGDRFDFAFRDPTLEDHEEGKKYGTEEDVTAEELAKFVLESKMYGGGPIRLIACEAGNPGGFAAQDLADILQVTIMAPTEIISIAFDGSYEIKSKNGKKGYWRVIEPKPRLNKN